MKPPTRRRRGAEDPAIGLGRCGGIVDRKRHMRERLRRVRLAEIVRPPDDVAGVVLAKEQPEAGNGVGFEIEDGEARLGRPPRQLDRAGEVDRIGRREAGGFETAMGGARVVGLQRQSPQAFAFRQRRSLLLVERSGLADRQHLEIVALEHDAVIDRVELRVVALRRRPEAEALVVGLGIGEVAGEDDGVVDAGDSGG